ncbi:sensor histidine kinase ['Paenibacillus yunnanensis' Narsing Rao et al. 2020]|uniref:sensor histidine kinase n=1 Tax=Paenibacillus tengchongensis TaxID=2608684 RepID=UPI00124D8EDE|nr:HAMP domain-containing sensor histidine kinase [Paenibacillus tengchongensis]
MKRFNLLILWTLITGVSLIGGFWFWAQSGLDYARSKEYRIEVNRILGAVQEGADPSALKLQQSDYRYIRKVRWMAEDSGGELETFFAGEGVADREEYTVRPVYNGDRLTGYLQLTYTVPEPDRREVWAAVMLLAAALAAVLGLLLYIRGSIIRPFHQIGELPFALARGHLMPGVKEQKHRYFGRLLWGLDALRETLEAQKQANIRLQKERQTLIASLSHELKTPVAAIKLYASALYGNLYNEEAKRTETARRIGQQAEIIEGQIAELITASSSPLQEIDVRNHEFYLSDWLQKVVHNHRERLELRKIRLETGPYEDKLLRGDADKLQEVLDNLLDNAVKYGDGGRIRLSFRVEEYRQLIEVENSGTPLSPAELPHIFSSFWRGSNAAGKPGNGLGLYLSRQLMRQMDGDLYAESREQGMIFVLVLRF